MGKCYSLDLRERVVRFVSAGGSRREAALRLGVSPSFAVKLVARYRNTGLSLPAKQGRPAGGGKLGRHRGFLIRRVQEMPDITMPELAGELEAAFGVKTSPASLSRILCKAGFTFKKNAAGFGAGARRCQKGASELGRLPPPKDAA